MKGCWGRLGYSTTSVCRSAEPQEQLNMRMCMSTANSFNHWKYAGALGAHNLDHQSTSEIPLAMPVGNHCDQATNIPFIAACRLKVDVLINAVSLGFLGLQVLLGALAVVRFAGAARVT